MRFFEVTISMDKERRPDLATMLVLEASSSNFQLTRQYLVTLSSLSAEAPKSSWRQVITC